MLQASARPVAASAFAKPTLVDTPLSNNGARVRWVLYKKKLEQEVDIVSPATFGAERGPGGSQSAGALPHTPVGTATPFF